MVNTRTIINVKGSIYTQQQNNKDIVFEGLCFAVL